MVDFLVKKRQLLDEIRCNTTTWRHVDASWIAYGTSAKHGKKYGGVFGKARHTFRHVFNLGITTLSNVSTKVSFSVWGSNRAQHK